MRQSPEAAWELTTERQVEMVLYPGTSLVKICSLPFHGLESQVHTSAVNSSDNSVNIKLGACIITNPTIPKTISARKAQARFHAPQFSGSREDLEGIGRFRIRPPEVMRKTLPERLEEVCLDKAVAAIVFHDFLCTENGG
jgi:hypothetical protein